MVKRSILNISIFNICILVFYLYLTLVSGDDVTGSHQNNILLSRRRFTLATHGSGLLTQNEKSTIDSTIQRPIRRFRGRSTTHIPGVLEPSRQLNETQYFRHPDSEIHLRSTPTAHFIGKVLIGTPPQEFDLVFDTGSTNLQVVGVECKQLSCLKVRRFDPDLSSTFKLSETSPLDVTFGTGRIGIKIGTDVVTIGPYRIKNLPFGVIYRESSLGESNIFNTINFEGLIGLGLPYLELIENSTLGARLSDSDSQLWEFAIYISNPDAPELKTIFENDPKLQVEIPGTLMIGGADPMYYMGPIKMVPVGLNNRYWQSPLKELYIGDEKVCCENNDENIAHENHVVFDSGTTYNTFPTEVFDLMEKFFPSTCRYKNGGIIYSDYPTLRYILENGNEIEITPDMYLLDDDEDDPNNCQLAFMTIDSPFNIGHLFVLGEVPFMRHYFTIYRRDLVSGLSEMGYAKAKHTAEGVERIVALKF